MKFELDYWENYGGVENFDLHLPIYQSIFPLNNLDYRKELVLDVGSGAISVFEKLAPKDADIQPFDILAEDYNRIAPNKKFKIRCQVPKNARFSLITMFNMIDHVDDPDNLLAFVSQHLRQDGRVWLATHLDQPHGAEGHPQNFSYRSIVALVSRHFSIESCGIIREGIPIPYMWYAVLRPTEILGQRPGFCVLQGAFTYYRLQSIRAITKALKLIGMRHLVSKNWQF